MSEVADLLALGSLSRGCAPLPVGGWQWARFSGQVTELTGRDGLSTVGAALLREAQTHGEPAVWILTGDEPHPGDLAAGGIDLGALAFLRGVEPLAAAEQLLQSGAFGLVLVDWPGGRLPTGVQQRLARQAREQSAALVFLVRKGPGRPSLGPLVNLQLEVRSQPCGAVARARKDRRGQPLWQREFNGESALGLSARGTSCFADALPPTS